MRAAARGTRDGQTRDIPVPGQGASAHARVCDHAGPDGNSHVVPVHAAFRPVKGVGARIYAFRGSMAGLCTPLPTLRHCPYEQLRTARGRCGSLLLHRSGLPPPTPCRSPGALTVHFIDAKGRGTISAPRRAERTGRPLGPATWPARLEVATDRAMTQRKLGPRSESNKLLSYHRVIQVFITQHVA